MATWMITGANRGIGLEFCKILLARGETVVAASRNPDGARDLWELAADFKGRFRSVKLDVSDAKSVAACASELGDQTIDVLVNNAGILNGEGESLNVLKFEEVAKTLEVNTIGPMRVSRAFLPMLMKAKEPKLVSISSRMGSLADNKSGGHYAYRMSKTALNMFHSNFAIEFPKIASAALHPGWVQTDMGGSQAPLVPHDSAESLIKVIDGLATNKSGSFLNYNGEPLPW
jgi:NAD(P)-dependent dehydrogenase (short-subunit alcohol dehydrogenase family)